VAIETPQDDYDPWNPLPWEIRQTLLKHGIIPSHDLVEALVECAKEYAREREDDMRLEASERDR
jgi:hypothetical protein